RGEGTWPSPRRKLRGMMRLQPREQKMSHHSTLLASALFVLGIAAHAGEVVLYSSNSVEAINAVTDEFNKKNPSIRISPVRGSTGAMMQRIKAEAGSPKADIFWSGGFPALGTYKEYFAAYKSPEAAGLQPVYHGPN